MIDVDNNETVTINGKTRDYAAAVQLMDDEILERLHSDPDVNNEDTTPQSFMDAYATAHREKYDAEFTCD